MRHMLPIEPLCLSRSSLVRFLSTPAQEVGSSSIRFDPSSHGVPTLPQSDLLLQHLPLCLWVPCSVVKCVLHPECFVPRRQALQPKSSLELFRLIWFWVPALPL